MLNPSDTIWTDSCAGACVDVFAPAHAIKSAEYKSADGSQARLSSGTSYSSPQVAGYASVYLEYYRSDPDNSQATPGKVWEAVKGNATGNIDQNQSSPVLGSVTNGGFTAPNNFLLFYGAGSRCRLVTQ